MIVSIRKLNSYLFLNSPQQWFESPCFFYLIDIYTSFVTIQPVNNKFTFVGGNSTVRQLLIENSDIHIFYGVGCLQKQLQLLIMSDAGFPNKDVLLHTSSKSNKKQALY